MADLRALLGDKWTSKFVEVGVIIWALLGALLYIRTVMLAHPHTATFTVRAS